MPQNNIMTDAQLKHLYFGIAKHYREIRERNPDASINDIYNELYFGVYTSLNGNASSLRHLDAQEKLKAYKILNTFIAACPPDPKRPAARINFFRFGTPPVVIIQYYSRPHYCAGNDFVFTWLLLSSFNRPYYYRPGGFGPGHHHHHGHTQGGGSNEDTAKVMAIILLVAIAAVAIVLTLIALYYVLNEMLNSGERFFYHEGWLQASISLLSVAAGAAASAILASLFVSAPLASLAILAGIVNPVGIVVFGVVCLSIIGAAATCFITHQIQEYVIKAANPDAIDPYDPHRFLLTDAETSDLEKKDIDPVKVKCAMVALRAQIGEKPVPSLLSRSCNSRGEIIQDCLDKFRQLRRGELSEVVVGNMRFDCHLTTDVYAAQGTPKMSLA